MVNVIAVFFGMALCDALWAWYFISIATKRKYAASLASGLIILVGATVTVEYVRNPVLRYSAAAGAAVGTLAVLKVHDWYEKRKSLGHIEKSAD